MSSGIHHGRFGPCVDLVVDGKPMVLNCRMDMSFQGTCGGDCAACAIAKAMPGKDNGYADPADPSVYVIIDDHPNTAPDAVLEKSRKLLGRLPRAPPRLTVGDLSVVSAEKKERRRVWEAKKANRKDGATVGDLSVSEDAKVKRKEERGE